ncbi:ATP-binding protein [Streptomyces tubercidicus]
MLEPPPPMTWRITLPRGATAIPIARAMVRTAMQDLRMTADRTTAQLLTAELVTNALKHTCGADPIELVVEQRSAGCRIEVHDDGPMLVEGLGDPLPPGDAGDGGDEDDGQAGADPGAYADGSRASDGTAAADDTEAPAPALACADHDGRGLVLIRSLSAASGCRPTPRGKAVWFTLPELRRPRRR